MKRIFPIILLISISSCLLAEEDGVVHQSNGEKHIRGAEQLADEQDELSADVQQLVMEQTVEQVIELLSEVEGIMDETTDYLAEADTGGKTIAAQTEIIEKIHAAAQAKQQSGQGKSGEEGSAMMDMMERMMGKEPGKEPEEGEGEGEGGEKAGKGQTGESDTGSGATDGKAGQAVEERTVPKAAGKAGKGLPSEFQGALDAYNRGLEEVTK